MPEPATGQIFNPFSKPATPPAEPAAAKPASIERDPNTGRFLKPGLSAALLRDARTAGLTDDDLGEMTAEDIRSHINDHKWNDRLEKVFALKERAQEAPRPAAAEPAFDLGVKGYSEDSEKGIADDIVTAMKRLQTYFDGEIKKLREEFSPVAQHVHSQAKAQNESFERRMERFYARHPAVYGQGTLKELEKSDPEFRDSPEFFARMQTFAAWKKSGESAEDLEAGLEREHAARFGGRAQAAAADETDEIREWEAGIYGRPTQRAAAEPPPGTDKAVQGVRSKLAEINGSNGRGRVRPGGRGAYLNPTK